MFKQKLNFLLISANEIFTTCIIHNLIQFKYLQGQSPFSTFTVTLSFVATTPMVKFSRKQQKKRKCVCVCREGDRLLCNAGLAFYCEGLCRKCLVFPHCRFFLFVFHAISSHIAVEVLCVLCRKVTRHTGTVAGKM